MKKRKGSALVFTLMIMVVGSILIMSLFFLVKSDLLRTNSFRESYENIYIAESGINALELYIKGDTTNTSNQAAFRTAYEGSSKDLDLTINFPNIDTPCEINITEAPSGDLYEGFMIVESKADNKVVYYLVRDTGTDYIFTKYVDR